MDNDSSRKTGIRLVLAVRSALARLRDEAVPVELRYLQRLLDFQLTRADSVDDEQSNQRKKYATSLSTRIRDLGTSFCLVPALVRQTSKLMTSRRESDPVLIVVMASNRLSLHDSVGARASLSALAASLGENNATLAEEILRARRIILVDPLSVSRLWPNRQRCWREEILIVDGLFLLALFLADFLTSPFKHTKHCFILIREFLSLPNTERANSVRSLAAIFITETFESLVGKQASSKALFFTCNSLLAEMLRANLLRDERCKAIYEVMHGVGSIHAERFFSRVLSASGACSKKHFFVPQLPNLPLYGAFENKAFDKPFAINGVLNQYSLQQQLMHDSIEHFVSSEVRKLEDQIGSTTSIIVSILGNTPHDHRLFGSSSFHAECTLISLIAAYREEQGCDMVIVYVPHPVHSSVEFDHPVFSRNDVKVYRQSIFSWLVSDICVSLLSSSVFEAAYFGAQAFTPLVACDEWFPDQYLRLVSHPESGSVDDFKSALRRSLSSGAVMPRVDYETRVKQRLKRTGWHWKDEGQPE